MAKRRARAANWTGERREDSLDTLFASMRTKAQQDLEQDISIGTESESMLVGLPLPALCLRYLFQSTTFPLSRITQITGEEGSCKTGLLVEMIRWHMVYGGGGCFCENELKDSPELRQSILQWNARWLNRLEVVPTHSLEAWQDALSTFVQIARDMQDADGGPGRTVPIAFAIDSLMATAPEAEIEAVKKEGHAMRGYALAANLIARYMRTMPDRIREYPFSIIGTNHLKPAVDLRGFPVSNIPGGKAVKFMETFEIEMKQSAHKDIDLLEYGGLRVDITCRKNSLGPSRKKIQAEMLWWYSEVDGVFRQQTAWDWDTATIEMLTAFENAKGKATLHKRLMEICDIRIISRGARKAWSRALGIPQDDPQEYRILGAALEGRPDLLTQIYQVLGITTRRPFQPGMDYQDLLATAREEAHVAVADLYQDIANLPQVGADALGVATQVEVEADEGFSSDERASAEMEGDAVIAEEEAAAPSGGWPGGVRS
jgi:RecA/RadA recombinase